MKRLIILLFFLLPLAWGGFSCSKMNDLHDKYLKDGEIIYLGKFDSLSLSPGKNRLKVEYWLSDPKVKKTEIFWSLKTKSIRVDVSLATDPDRPGVFFIDDLEEGALNFDIYNRNAEMTLSSVAENVSTNVYGDNFQETSVINRSVKTSYNAATSVMQIVWSGVYDYSYQTEVVYTDGNDSERTIVTPSAKDTTLLNDFPPTGTFTYRTVYLPTENCIDYFYTDWATFTLSATPPDRL